MQGKRRRAGGRAGGGRGPHQEDRDPEALGHVARPEPAAVVERHLKAREQLLLHLLQRPQRAHRLRLERPGGDGVVVLKLREPLVEVRLRGARRGASGVSGAEARRGVAGTGTGVHSLRWCIGARAGACLLHEGLCVRPDDEGVVGRVRPGLRARAGPAGVDPVEEAEPGAKEA